MIRASTKTATPRGTSTWTPLSTGTSGNGTSSSAAGLLTRAKASNVASTVSHSSSISASARPPRCHAKKIQLHSALSTSCATKRLSARRVAGVGPRRQTSQAAAPISAYSTLHTGPKMPAGGAHAGRVSWP